MKLWRVDDVMTKDVVAVREDTPYRDVVDVLIGHRVSAVPVMDSVDHVVGVVSEADLLLKVSDVPASAVFVTWRDRRDRRKARGRVARDVMSAPAVTVLPSLSVAAAARRMQREHVKRLPVEDGVGRLIGIVTRSDLLKVQLRSDAEIDADVTEEVLGNMPAAQRGAVRAGTTDGVVTLSGRLHFRSAADLTVALTADLPGVVGVDNQLAYDIDDRMAVGSESGAPFGVA
jgi:CBS-domain-containing membrane protein